MNTAHLNQTFKSLFDADHDATFFAPGRINLIGEHIDYNGGRVFPCAIDLGTWTLMRKRDDRTIRIHSLNFEEKETITLSLDNLDYDKAHSWGNYIKGTLVSFIEQGYSFDTGFDALFYGNIPTGSGLSSSASIQVCAAWMMKTIYNFDISRTEIALLVKNTENNYMGVSTGIMDQFIIANGRKNCALLLDTSTLDCSYVPINFTDLNVVIMNTNKQRELIHSPYNERLAQCQEALKIVRQHYDVSALCALDMSQLEAIQASFNDPLIYKRARHVISENLRTLAAVTALKANDFKTFGDLMNASHASLRDDYDVTGIELDTLVKTALSCEGVYGARVTGAGYGGCAIALVATDCIEALKERVSHVYEKTVGTLPSFYSVTICDGVHQL